MKTTQKTLSTDAAIFNADGFSIATGVTVIKHTDEDGEYLIVGRTLHAMSDILKDEDNHGRFIFRATGGILRL